MRIKDTGRVLLTLAGVLALGACNKDSQSAGGDNARKIELAPVPPAQPQLADVAKPEPPAAVPAAKPAKKKTPEPAKAPEAAPAPAPKTVTVTHLPEPGAAAAAAPAGAATAAKPTQVFGVVTSGTTFNVSPVARLCTDLYKTGDQATGTIDATVQGIDGAVLPMGSTVTMRVTNSQRGKGSDTEAAIAFELIAVKVGNETYNAT
ncbi:MAG: hypothetical protein HYR75_06170, partial [Gemmatimonadetes bacterium]|nr:hypothetical protein [Gemmatimonadota bacterium]